MGQHLQHKLFVEAKDWEASRVQLISPEEDTDGVKGDKNYYIEGIFIQSEIKNRNGRNYPKPLLEKCVQKYMADRMKPGFYRSFGELGHPDGVEINLDKVSHYVTDLNWKGNDVYGKAKILTTHPCGRMVKSFLDEKLVIGVSTRGLGTLAKNESHDGSKKVESYEMIAIDIVADPSAPKGFVDGILEHKEYIIKDNNTIVECFEGLERTISTLPRTKNEKEKYLIEAIEKFVKNLRLI